MRGLREDAENRPVPEDFASMVDGISAAIASVIGGKDEVVRLVLTMLHAALDGRDYVIPDDVQALAVPVLAHRLFPAAQATQVLADLTDRLPAP